MLAWLHQAIASEKELLHLLLDRLSKLEFKNELMTAGRGVLGWYPLLYTAWQVFLCCSLSGGKTKALPGCLFFC